MRILVLTLFCAGVANLALANVLSKIDSQLNGQTQLIQFTFDDLARLPKVFSTGNDLVMDFSAVSIARLNPQMLFESGYIHELALAAVGSRIRVVIIGGAKYRYTLNSHGHIASISFSDQAGSSSQLVNPQITSIKFQRDDDGGGIVEIPYSGNSFLHYKAERLGNRLVLRLSDVSYAKSLLQRIDATDFATPIKYIDSQVLDNQLTISLTNRKVWDYAIYQLQGKLLVNVRKVDQDSLTTLPNLSETKGEKASLNFQNIDVRSLLQLLADFSGYNILVSDSITGTMSLKLNNVPWDQALQIILTAKNLGMRRDGNVIRVAPLAELATLSKELADSHKSQEASEPLDTVMIRLKYAQATTLQAMLQQQGGSLASDEISSFPPSSEERVGSSHPVVPSKVGGVSAPKLPLNSLLSSRGAILVDARTNTLIINDTPSRLKEMKELIDKLDIPVKQVLIEARIVEASSDFERSLGSRLLLAGVTENSAYSNTLENGITINQQGTNSLRGDPTRFVNQNFGVASGSSLAAIFAPNSDRLIGLEVDAQEAMNQGRTISSPKVMTANYQAANIQQGVQIPYQQVSSAGNTNIAFISATLKLQVTPQITEDGYILLNIAVQKDTPSQTLQVQGTPAIDTNSVTTQVRIKDGATILIGGIYVDSQSKIVQQVPLLGDIPYLGWLFKAQNTANNKSELLVFITPRIIANNLDNDI